MKRETKLAIALGVAGAAAAAVAFAVFAEPKPKTPTLPPRGAGKPDPAPSSPPPVAIDNAPVESGYHTVGWYTYQGNSDHPLWIRVDAGQPTEAYAGLTEERDWQWSIIEGYYAADGSWVNAGLISRGNVDDIMQSGIDPLFGAAGSHTDLTAQLVARAAADMIDTMFPGDA